MGETRKGAPVPVVLRSLVTTVSSLMQTKAAIELMDDDTLVISKVDKRTGLSTEPIFTAPLHALVATGSRSVLTLNSAGVRRRVDFAEPNRGAFAIGGAIGVAVAALAAGDGGIGPWVEALRSRGVEVRYSKGRARQIVVLVFLVVVVVASFGYRYWSQASGN
jgi:hypothetical protein